MQIELGPYIDYVDLRRPDMTLRKDYGTNSLMKMTRNTRVLKSPYYRGVQLWEKLPVEAQFLGTKQEFRYHLKTIKHMT